MHPGIMFAYSASPSGKRNLLLSVNIGITFPYPPLLIPLFVFISTNTASEALGFLPSQIHQINFLSWAVQSSLSFVIPWDLTCSANLIDCVTNAYLTISYFQLFAPIINVFLPLFLDYFDYFLKIHVLLWNLRNSTQKDPHHHLNKIECSSIYTKFTR